MCFCLLILEISPIPKALVQETETHRRRHLLAEGHCVVQEKKLNKVEGKLTRTKVKFAKLLSEAEAVSMTLLADKSAENKVGRCSCLLFRAVMKKCVLYNMYFCVLTLGISPTPKALALETEAHRRCRLLAEGNFVVKEKRLNKVEGHLMRAKCKFAKLQMDIKVMESEAHAASSKLAAVIQEAQEMIRGHEKIMSAKTEHALTVIGNLRSTLTASRKKANTLNSATAKLKLLRLKEKDRYRGPTLKSLQAENVKLLKALDLSTDNLERALADCANPDNVTSWVNILGKKGHRYNMYVKEMGMQLMASELSASQAVYCLTVFMMKTYPDLVAGVDYRIPGESVFKEWAESIYDVVCELNRSRLDAR
jgi:hypothetical protein